MLKKARRAAAIIMKEHSFKIQSFTIPQTSIHKRKIYSQILIKGKWLHDAGYLPGDHVHLIIEENRLVIERSAS